MDTTLSFRDEIQRQSLEAIYNHFNDNTG